jgi:hypothetical protein
MFDTYFSGINSHHYGTALSVFDPAGTFPDNPADEHQMARALVTTRDSRVVLVHVWPPGPEPVQRATLTFRSHQGPGYGPANDPEQTCTVWHLTYQLAQSGDGYLIDGAKGGPSSC